MTLKVSDISHAIEELAPLALQESYDNAGLIVGNAHQEVKAALVCVDVTESVIDEAIEKNCNLIVTHHPFIFKGIKRINGNSDVERCIIKAIKNDIAIYAAHTNLDNVKEGVNSQLAVRLGLENIRILQPKSGMLMKLVTFVPKLHAHKIREALFQAGAGNIGNYDSCSFFAEGTGSFKANDDAHPFVGNLHEIHYENEIRLEVILPSYLRSRVISALYEAHPYEEPAYDLIALSNQWNEAGAGLVGNLPKPVDVLEFLEKLKTELGIPVLRHTRMHKKEIQKIAFCGGSGSFLLKDAIAADADMYISGDFKYHEFFDAEDRIIIVDAGHFETEQFTKHTFYEIITKKFPKFAVLISDINTNPIKYF